MLGLLMVWRLVVGGFDGFVLFYWCGFGFDCMFVVCCFVFVLNCYCL